jgi:hypothetical protein
MIMIQTEFVFVKELIHMYHFDLQTRQSSVLCCFGEDKPEDEPVKTTQPRSTRKEVEKRPLFMIDESTISFIINGKNVTGKNVPNCTFWLYTSFATFYCLNI